jgi:uncharacterized membrane protein
MYLPEPFALIIVLFAAATGLGRLYSASQHPTVEPKFIAVIFYATIMFTVPMVTVTLLDGGVNPFVVLGLALFLHISPYYMAVTEQYQCQFTDNSDRPIFNEYAPKNKYRALLLLSATLINIGNIEMWVVGDPPIGLTILGIAISILTVLTLHTRIVKRLQRLLFYY